MRGLFLLLKSDHFGIEITTITLSPGRALLLKSDHFGIEIKTLPTGYNVIAVTKIRPFWDWNIQEKILKKIATGLKSDHFGIEINTIKVVFMEDRLLKSDHFGIEIFTSPLGYTLVVKLKSDHFGIEILFRLTRESGVL